MILLTVAYDGTNYAGWQRQTNALAVQQVVENALEKLLGVKAAILGAGRTDAGVHALGQKALIQKPADIIVPSDKLRSALNGYLPADIRIMDVETVGSGFHPLRCPARKTYVYSIYNGSVMPPVLRLYRMFERRKLDLGAMREAAGHFVGIHDFAGFSSAGSRIEMTVREIYSLDVEERDGHIDIAVCGNGFLYNMVRIIAGTLVFAGLDRLSPGDMPGIIASGDRKRAGKTLPAHGLMLKEIAYDMKGLV